MPKADWDCPSVWACLGMSEAGWGWDVWAWLDLSEPVWAWACLGLSMWELFRVCLGITQVFDPWSPIPRPKALDPELPWSPDA